MHEFATADDNLARFEEVVEIDIVHAVSAVNEDNEIEVEQEEVRITKMEPREAVDLLDNLLKRLRGRLGVARQTATGIGN